MNLFTEQSHLRSLSISEYISDAVNLDAIQSSDKKLVFPKTLVIVDPLQLLNLDCDYSQVENLFVIFIGIGGKFDIVINASEIFQHIQKTANDLKTLKLEIGKMNEDYLKCFMGLILTNCKPTQKPLDEFSIWTHDSCKPSFEYIYSKNLTFLAKKV